MTLLTFPTTDPVEIILATNDANFQDVVILSNALEMVKYFVQPAFLNTDYIIVRIPT